MVSNRGRTIKNKRESGKECGCIEFSSFVGSARGERKDVRTILTTMRGSKSSGKSGDSALNGNGFASDIIFIKRGRKLVTGLWRWSGMVNGTVPGNGQLHKTLNGNLFQLIESLNI